MNNDLAKAQIISVAWEIVKQAELPYTELMLKGVQNGNENPTHDVDAQAKWLASIVIDVANRLSSSVS